MPRTGTICRTGEEEDKNHAKGPIVIINFDQIMDEVEATTKGVFSCTDDNMTDTFISRSANDHNTAGTTSKTAIETSPNDHV